MATLICIGDSWLRALGLTSAEIDTIPREIVSLGGGLIRSPLYNWGGSGNSLADVRSLESLAANEPRHLVLVGMSEGYGGVGSLMARGMCQELTLLGDNATDMRPIVDSTTVRAVLDLLQHKIPPFDTGDLVIAACKKKLAL